MFDAFLALGITTLVFLVLLWKRGAPADLVFLGGLVGVTLCGIISPRDALLGFANPAVVTIASLYVVAAGLRQTGALDLIGHKLLGNIRSEKGALLRLTLPIVGLSALINNTPIVAMTVPTVIDWCRRTGVSPSRLLMPISYLAILGGACSLIGTSTNLVVNAMMVDHQGIEGMHLFEIGYVGLPCALVGIIYLLLVGQRRLPNRIDLLESLGEYRRDYLVEMLVQETCRLVGQTVEQAGLRNLPGLFLIEINRQNEVITPVTPRDRIEAGDRLVFTGVVSTIVDLEKIPGLVPAVDMAYETDPVSRQRRHLTEAVLSNSSPLIGSTVKEAKFRQLYNAAVLAVHRNGVRMTNKVGSIQLEPGDTLLLQTGTEFINNFRNSRDFYLISSVDDDRPRRHDRVWVSLGLFAILITLLTITSWMSHGGAIPAEMTAIIAVMAAVLMVVTRCLSMAQARSSFELQVLLTIGAALGLGRALEQSGAAEQVADWIINVAGDQNPLVLLMIIYFLTLIFTEMITNTAVAALMFPLAIAVAQEAGFVERPFIMAIALAASCSFITPIGYQTNLMVMGPGGYRPADYLKIGLPLTFLVMVTALIFIPIIWPPTYP
ncbi:MAG: TRAP transporter large permease subunit [Planctomycetales bacterium]|nr:TRAP transporter large permease subunit [Planctomycetales bacterium]NIM10007.1 TRAP transporter large permease subunit [Planctomycetales bacterium]NIN09447.1 TRAP transporter large permease subunit [Planctomycetales bacterium]NIN78556.1 TRAP transporter large permease subunit [Planctomycetales bacterium]NIO35748.1 TRAP transporter large permease subunit [Planctomycetales bacterium]